MKWVGISGSWRYMSPRIDAEVRRVVKDYISRDYGVVSGGAPGVDYCVLEQALALNSKADKIKIFLPSSLEFYIQHLRRRAGENVISVLSSEALIRQLQGVSSRNKDAIIEGYEIPGNLYIEKQQYYDRNTSIVEASDEFVAFHVNKTEGTQDAINKARKYNIPVKIFEYTVKGTSLEA